jgi:hypothetical protein
VPLGDVDLTVRRRLRSGLTATEAAPSQAVKRRRGRPLFLYLKDHACGAVRRSFLLLMTRLSKLEAVRGSFPSLTNRLSKFCVRELVLQRCQCIKTHIRTMKCLCGRTVMCPCGRIVKCLRGLAAKLHH